MEKEGEKMETAINRISLLLQSKAVIHTHLLNYLTH